MLGFIIVKTFLDRLKESIKLKALNIIFYDLTIIESQDKNSFT